MGEIVKAVLDDMAGGCITSLESDRLPNNAYSRGLNTELRSIGGGKAIIGRRKGCTILNPLGAATTSPIVALHEFRTGGSTGDAGYKIAITADGSFYVYNDAGGTTTSLPDGVDDGVFDDGTAIVSFADANGYCYMVDGRYALRYGPDNVFPHEIGIAAPTTSHTLTANVAAGLHNGTYESRITFYDPVTQVESSAGPTVTTTIAPSNQAIAWSSLPTRQSLNGYAYQRRLYLRNTATMRNFYRAATVEDGTSTTYLTSIADSSLTVTGPSTTSNNQPPTTAKYIAFHHGRMFVADDNNLYYSHLPVDGVTHPEEFDAIAIEPVFPEDGQVIKGIFSAFDVLVILKTSSTIVLIGDDPDTWALRVIDPGIGCVASQSIAYASDRLYWWGEQGPASWDGSGSPVWVGTPLISATMATISQAPLITNNFRACRDFNRDRVLFAVATVGSVVNDTILPFNYRLNRWESDGWDVVDVGALAEFQDTNGQPYPAIGGTQGHIFKLGFGNNDGVQGTTRSGTFTAVATSTSTINDPSATFYTTGAAKLIGRKVTLVNQTTGKAVPIRARIASNTGTVLTLDRDITELTTGTGYTYYIGAIAFEWDSPWWTADDGLLKKRFMFVWAAPRYYKENGTLQLETAINKDVRPASILTHTSTATIASDSLYWATGTTTVWGTNLWAYFRNFPYRRIRVGRTGVMLQLRLRHYHNDADFDIPWIGYECERLSERLG